jgi:hypothetical protein
MRTEGLKRADRPFSATSPPGHDAQPDIDQGNMRVGRRGPILSDLQVLDYFIASSVRPEMA